MYPFKTIIVGTDLGPSSERALDMAISLALVHDAELILVHAFTVMVAVYPIPVAPPIDDVAAGLERTMEEMLEEVRRRLPRARGEVRHGEPHTEILAAAAEHHADLVVVGTHGHHGLMHLLRGSEAERVVRACHVPVLTVYSGPDAEAVAA